MIKILQYAILFLLIACVTSNNLEKYKKTHFAALFYDSFLIITDYVFFRKNHTTHNGTCKDYENQFKHGHELYYTCTIKSTIQDFWFCKHCSGEYWMMFSGYEFLKTTIDSKNGSVSCISELINQDRMDFWSRIHAEAIKLWDDANCGKCYDWNNTLVFTNEPHPQNLTVDFQTFLNLTEKLQICEQNHTKLDNVCADCESFYMDLNKFYEGIKKKDKTNICFDIENSMNKSRIHWSGNLGCCHDDEASFVVFTVLASIIGALPIVFYFSAYIVTKRREDLSPVTDGETQNVGINNAEPMPGTSIAGSSNASTAIVDDESPSHFVKNNTKDLKESVNSVTKSNYKDIAKKNNIEINPNNLLMSPQRDTGNASQNLIELEKSPAPGSTTRLLNLDPF